METEVIVKTHVTRLIVEFALSCQPSVTCLVSSTSMTEMIEVLTTMIVRYRYQEQNLPMMQLFAGPGDSVEM